MSRRCPWCGKITDRHADQSRAFSKRKKTPYRFVFAQCKHCNNYYGQNVNYKMLLAWLGIMVLLAVVARCVQNASVLFFGIFPPFFWIFMRYTRMDENEEKVPLPEELWITAEVLEQYEKIKSGNLYFLQADFDEHDAFSVAPPLYISKIRKKTKLQGHLLYDHAENDKYNEVCNIYDGSGTLIAKVKIYKKLT